MEAKLKAYCSPDKVQTNVFWGFSASSQEFTIDLFFNIEFARSASDLYQEISEDSLKNRVVVYQRQRTENYFEIILRSYMIGVLASLVVCETVEIEFLPTGETFTMSNVRFEDTGEGGEIIGVGKCTFDIESVFGSGCEQTEFTQVAC